MTWFLGFFAMPRQGLLSRAQAPFLGPEHHRAQNLEGAVGRARLVLARRVEPRGHVLRADAVERRRPISSHMAVPYRLLSGPSRPNGTDTFWMKAFGRSVTSRTG